MHTGRSALLRVVHEEDPGAVVREARLRVVADALAKQSWPIAARIAGVEKTILGFGIPRSERPHTEVGRDGEIFRTDTADLGHAFEHASITREDHPAQRGIAEYERWAGRCRERGR